MKIDTTFLRSKVARRIFILFVCCALLPITALALLSFGHVTKQLNVKGQRQLHQTSKDIGMYIYERLLFLEAEMKMVASSISPAPRTIPHTLPEGFDTELRQRFKGLVRITDSEKSLTLFGRIQDIPELTPSEGDHIWSGKTVISTMYHPSPHIFMSVALDPKHPKRGILLGEINPAYLWGINEENPWLLTAELCVLDHANNILFSTLPAQVSFPETAVLTMNRSVSGQFEWVHEEERYIAGYWSIFLQARYFTPKWIVVLSEAKADVLAPLTAFKKTFPLVILLSLWVVVLLSIIQIRRSLIPLERLREGTKQIAMRDFDSRVTITSGDEFEELAASFNAMAARLGKQFKTLTTIAEIDRAILSTLDVERIIDVVRTRFHSVLPCDCLSVTLLDPSAESTARIYIGCGETGTERETERITLGPEEIQKLSDNPEWFVTGAEETAYLAPLTKIGMRSFVVMPLILKQRLAGIITLGYRKLPVHDQEDLAQARQLADQVAVALSNARLIEELNQLHWGILTALARAIDAKSPWTAGHSERVTNLALKIGKVLRLSPEELDDLHRGGLLHDIGKIGVPADILDKTGKLTEAQEKLMREHTRWGARILEPIAAYATVIPIVLQHHECFDGTGYPDGIAGETISLGARIFAVVDYFDALTSHRPYRHAMDRADAIAAIKQGEGSKFDPTVVQAFVEVMTGEEREGGI